eukprot:CAMPEP_0197723716 /NCGR_PEP_ID=MMETSP1434-20131217/5917_1 /TAXON_ID=265543 /ORGANISM="Minutocellus polymorphus, Strain CCMP3303" /LENGTH=76 /DNA_ID=CAMNT_0043308999 /DNA_START=29 /DNA_END=255 /DNA_ORIENTATION=+
MENSEKGKYGSRFFLCSTRPRMCSMSERIWTRNQPNKKSIATPTRRQSPIDRPVNLEVVPAFNSSLGIPLTNHPMG